MTRVLIPIDADPQPWTPPHNPENTGVWEFNDKLRHVSVELNDFPRHDTVVVDKNGRRYAGLDDGRIIHWQPERNPKISTYTQLMGRPAGMAIDESNTLYVVEELTGSLWRILPDKRVIKLPSTYQNKTIKYLNDVAVHGEKAFATQSSTHWPLSETSRATLEHRNDGAVYMWNNTKGPYKIATGLSFPNGITIAHDKQSILVTETTEYRITRIWFAGPRKGQKQVIVDNLPGYPSDVTPAADGRHYWATLFDYRNNLPLVDRLSAHPSLRYVMLNFPSNWFPKRKGTPAVFLFNDNGQIIKTFQAPSMSDLPGFSSIVQSNNTLILSSANPLKYHDDRVFLLNLTSALYD